MTYFDTQLNLPPPLAFALTPILPVPTSCPRVTSGTWVSRQIWQSKSCELDNAFRSVSGQERTVSSSVCSGFTSNRSRKSHPARGGRCPGSLRQAPAALVLFRID